MEKRRDAILKTIDPYARIMDVPDRKVGIALLQKIEWCGRISHRSEDALTEASWERFLRAVVLGKGDWSIVEHACVSVDAIVDRGITHEWVRHRLASYTQESTRFVNYEKKMPASFIVPPGLTVGQTARWVTGVEQAELAYRAMIHDGASPQIARSAFPNALASRIVTTCNLRNWRHFLLMRTTREAHPQMRQVTIPLLKEFQERIPILFEDIEPEATQADNLRKMR